METFRTITIANEPSLIGNAVQLSPEDKSLVTGNAENVNVNDTGVDQNCKALDYNNAIDGSEEEIYRVFDNFVYAARQKSNQSLAKSSEI